MSIHDSTWEVEIQVQETSFRLSKSLIKGRVHCRCGAPERCHHRVASPFCYSFQMSNPPLRTRNAIKKIRVRIGHWKLQINKLHYSLSQWTVSLDCIHHYTGDGPCSSSLCHGFANGLAKKLSSVFPAWPFSLSSKGRHPITPSLPSNSEILLHATVHVLLPRDRIYGHQKHSSG